MPNRTLVVLCATKLPPLPPKPGCNCLGDKIVGDELSLSDFEVQRRKLEPANIQKKGRAPAFCHCDVQHTKTAPCVTCINVFSVHTHAPADVVPPVHSSIPIGDYLLRRVIIRFWLAPQENIVAIYRHRLRLNETHPSSRSCLSSRVIHRSDNRSVPSP
jgi:hypothetical protein